MEESGAILAAAPQHLPQKCYYQNADPDKCTAFMNIQERGINDKLDLFDKQNLLEDNKTVKYADKFSLKL